MLAQIIWRTAAALIIAVLAATAPAAADGPAVFKAHKCTKCHSAPGVDGGKRDLAKVGSKRSADWMAKFIKKEIANEGADGKKGKKHRKKFSGTQVELEDLVQWLASLK